jgi:hypothetical protein
MAPTDMKSEVEKVSLEIQSFEVASDRDAYQQDELNPEDREFLDSFGEERRRKVIRKVKAHRTDLYS